MNGTWLTLGGLAAIAGIRSGSRNAPKPNQAPNWRYYKQLADYLLALRNAEAPMKFDDRWALDDPVNDETAAAFWQYHLANDPKLKDLRWLGTGAFRSAMRMADGNVIKIPHRNEDIEREGAWMRDDLAATQARIWHGNLSPQLRDLLLPVLWEYSPEEVLVMPYAAPVPDHYDSHTVGPLVANVPPGTRREMGQRLAVAMLSMLHQLPGPVYFPDADNWRPGGLWHGHTEETARASAERAKKAIATDPPSLWPEDLVEMLRLVNDFNLPDEFDGGDFFDDINDRNVGIYTDPTGTARMVILDYGGYE